MDVRCPHCLVPFDAVEERSCTDLVCPSCGRDFSLASAETTCSYQPGVQVLGRFELLEESGSGRFGSVWKARDTQLERLVAVKIPRHRKLDRQETELFLRDARAAAQLRHPRIASVHEIGRDDETVYIVTDYIDGANLGEWLSVRPPGPNESAELVIKIAQALHHAHEAGVVHRDVKPSNIMMDRDGEPYVIDFGLARREVGEMTVTVEGHVLGTPAYMPPEQARGEGHWADRRSDIYSLGVVLFKLLTGELPFRGQGRMLFLQILEEEPPGLRKLIANVPRDLETITLKCLEKDPARRYQTAQELADDLGRYLTGEPIRARPVGRVERAWRWCRRHPDLASLSAALLMLLLAIAIIAPIIVIQRERLSQEAELQRLQRAHNLFQRASEEYNAGRALQGVALLSAAYELIGPDNPLRSSIRTLMPGWAYESGQPIVQNGVVLAAAFSPDGKSILIGGHDTECRARFWDAQTLLPIGDPVPHDGSVRAVAFSPDGSLALTGSEDGTARLWDTRTRSLVGNPMWHLTDGDPRHVLAAALSGSGIVATGASDHKARLWKAPHGEPHGDPLEFAGRGMVFSVAFHPNGHAVLTGSGNPPALEDASVESADGTAQMWDIRSRQRLGEPIRVSGPVLYAAAFNPDGSRVLTGSSDGTAQLWNSETRQLDGKLVAHVKEGKLLAHSGLVYAVAFSPDGRMVLTGSHDATARLWDGETGRPIGQPMLHDGWIMSVTFSPDGRTVMTGSADWTVRLRSIGDSGGRVLRHEADVHCAVFSANGRYVLTGGEDHKARLWESRTGQQLGEPLPHDAPVRAVAFSPDGSTLLTGSGDQVQRWIAQSGEPIGEPWKFGLDVLDIEFSVDGMEAFVHCAGGTVATVELRDYPSGDAKSSPLKIDARNSALARSLDQHLILVGYPQGVDSYAQLFDLQTVAPKGEPLRHRHRITAAAFSPDGRTIVTGGRDQEVRLWDIPTGTVRFSFQHNGIINSVAIDRYGSTILSGSDDKTARLWSAHTGLALGPPLQHSDRVTKVTLSPDGRLAATICEDGSVHLWDVLSSKRLMRPMQYEVPVDDCVFHPDGSVILFRCQDGTARLYDVPQQLPDDPKLIQVWARARSGFQVDERLEPRQLSQAEWLKAQNEIATME